MSTARVGLEGNKEASAELDKLDVKLIRLGNKVANPSISVEGKVKALADISAVDLAMDRLNKKFASPSTGSRIGKALVSGAAFRALFSGGGGGAGGEAAAGAGAAGGGGIADFLASPAGIGTIAGLAPIIASLTDALAGFGVGAVGAGGAGLLAAKFQPSVFAPGLANISKTLSTVTQSFGPSLGLLAVQFGKFTQGLAPTLAKLFGATLPFFRSFLSFAEQAAKVALPALTKVMQQMVSSGALKAMTQGFVYLVQGISGFLVALGPGMKAGALIFRAVADAIRGSLYALGDIFGWVGKMTGKLITGLHDDWDSFRHDTATIFDGIRHDTAQIWDGIYSDTIGNVIRLIKDVTGWFDKLPGSVQTALRGLGKMLYGIGTGAISEFLDGLKSVGSSVLGWIKNFFTGIPHAILSFLHMSPPHAGSAFFDLGANFMHHLEAGMQSRAARLRGASGNIGGSVNSWILASLRGAGEPLSWLPALQRLVSLESGGNPRAVDPISVLGQHAEGLWQMLPSTFAAYGGRGSLFNPVSEGIAALRYIASRYGSPFNIPGLFSGGYQGYAGGGMITEPILGIGLQSGRGYGFGERGPEMVIPRGGGTQSIVIEFGSGAEGRLTGALLEVLRKEVRVRGGGDVQLALGRP